MTNQRNPRGTDWLLTRITPAPPKEGTVNGQDENRGGAVAYLLLALLIVAVGVVVIAGAGR